MARGLDEMFSNSTKAMASLIGSNNGDDDDAVLGLQGSRLGKYGHRCKRARLHALMISSIVPAGSGGWCLCTQGLLYRLVEELELPSRGYNGPPLCNVDSQAAPFGQL